MDMGQVLVPCVGDGPYLGQEVYINVLCTYVDTLRVGVIVSVIGCRECGK